MRSYHQYCALARALDVVGDRWTLLIVRELLLRGPCRYTDLRDGLPGIATNLLADRLRELESAGLIRRETAASPGGAEPYRLTERGERLEPVLHELGRWGGPLLARAGRGDEFRAHWLLLPAAIHLKDHAPNRPPVTLEVRSGGEAITIEATAGVVKVRPGAASTPDAVLTGPPQTIIAVLTGKLGLAEAAAAGLRYEGDPATLRRLRPIVAA